VASFGDRNGVEPIEHGEEDVNLSGCSDLGLTSVGKTLQGKPHVLLRILEEISKENVCRSVDESFSVQNVEFESVSLRIVNACHDVLSPLGSSSSLGT
jgi:hypothetical protein